MMYWLFLLIAACFEVGWIYSLKFMEMKKIFAIRFSMLFNNGQEWLPLLPLLSYIFFGISNIYFFSLAMKGIQAATAFAVWTGMALVLSKTVDILVFKGDFNIQQLLFTALILAGIIGLKWFE